MDNIKIECLMGDYITKIVVEAKNERDAEILARAEHIRLFGNPSIVRAFKRI